MCATKGKTAEAHGFQPVIYTPALARGKAQLGRIEVTGKRTAKCRERDFTRASLSECKLDARFILFLRLFKFSGLCITPAERGELNFSRSPFYDNQCDYPRGWMKMRSSFVGKSHRAKGYKYTYVYMYECENVCTRERES